MPRYDRLPDGQRIRCYVAPRSAPFMDRWLVLFEDDPDPLTGGPVMSDNPDHPQGVSMMVDAVPPMTYGPKYHAEDVRFRRIPFAALRLARWADAELPGESARVREGLVTA